MNFGVVFCAIGIALWLMQVLHLITTHAMEIGRLPDRLDCQNWVVDSRTMRNARAVKIGAIFFFSFGLFGWVVTRDSQAVDMQPELLAYSITRLLLPMLLYLNFSMRFLIYRFSEHYVKANGVTEVMDSLRVTWFSPKGKDVPSQIVRWTNALSVLALFVLATLSFILN